MLGRCVGLGEKSSLSDSSSDNMTARDSFISKYPFSITSRTLFLTSLVPIPGSQGTQLAHNVSQKFQMVAYKRFLMLTL